MSAKYFVKAKASLLLILLLVIIILFAIVQPVNKLENSRNITTSTGTVSDSNQASVEKEFAEPNRPQHNNPAFQERTRERDAMVAGQLKTRNIIDPNVLKAMQVVPRHAFVSPSEQSRAYDDMPLPIEYGQTISQPYIVAFMTQALQLDPNSRVLEIGTGSGYQAAICAEIAKEVYTIEIVEGLAKSAAERLKELGYPNVSVKYGDGYFGWDEHAPYNAIIGTAAAGRVPQPLIEQLRANGRMIIPVGNPDGFQELIIYTKDKEGNIRKQSVLDVRFVPMTGEVQKPAHETVK